MDAGHLRNDLTTVQMANRTKIPGGFAPFHAKRSATIPKLVVILDLSYSASNQATDRLVPAALKTPPSVPPGQPVSCPASVHLAGNRKMTPLTGNHLGRAAMGS